MVETTKLRLEDLHPFLQFYLDIPEGFRLIQGAMLKTTLTPVDEFTAIYGTGTPKKGLVDLQFDGTNFSVKVGYLNEDGGVHYTTGSKELKGVENEEEALNHLERIASEIQIVFRLPSAPEIYNKGIPFEKSTTQ